jgi:glycosyltransferase involved in cell wall biosynthesis
MRNEKVCIVTRALNRLEYTAQCVATVRNHTRYPEYDHLVLNQASTDGTREWLDWIAKMPNQWYSRVRPIHLKKNCGDWGGMRAAIDFLGDAQYVVQLDNDIRVPRGWLTVMVAVLQAMGASAVMLRRTGVQNRIHGEAAEPLVFNEGQAETDSHQLLSISVVPKVVACYVCRTADFLRYAHRIPMCDQLVQAIGRPAAKIENLPCHQMEGFDSLDKSYIQHDKYGESEPRQVI